MIKELIKIIGSLGLVFIIAGVLNKKSKNSMIFYIIGGTLLLTYSISINDIIFIILQSTFIIASTYKLIKTNRGGKLTVKKLKRRLIVKEP